MATYRVGDTIHALVHDEFHDPVAARCKPGDDSPGNPCWYNAITYAFSIDGGRSFRQPPGTAHVVAPPPSRWDAAAAGRGGYQISGYLEPSNIVRGADGYFYVLIRAVPDIRRQKLRGTCVLRTRTLGEPSSWRAWDGQSFSLELTNPYDAPAEGSRPCAFVSHGRIGDLNGSLSYNTYLREYLLIGSWVRRSGSARVCGFFFSRSTDLVHWSSPELIREAALPHARAGCRPANAPRKGAELYPSILDPVDTSVNFERSGREPYLYFIRYGHHWAERQLLRQRIRLTRRDGHDPGASMR